MLAFGHHNHTTCARILDQRVGDLLGQTLLHLRPASIHLDQSGELAQPHHPVLGGNIAHMGHAVERQQVMLAHRIQFDVLDQHQFVGIHVEVLLQHIGRGSLQTGEQLAARAGDTVRRFHQPLALGILANRLQEQTYGLAHAFLVVCVFLPMARLYIFVHLISPLSLSTTTSARPAYVRNHMNRSARIVIVSTLPASCRPSA